MRTKSWNASADRLLKCPTIQLIKKIFVSVGLITSAFSWWIYASNPAVSIDDIGLNQAGSYGLPIKLKNKNLIFPIYIEKSTCLINLAISNYPDFNGIGDIAKNITAPHRGEITQGNREEGYVPASDDKNFSCSALKYRIEPNYLNITVTINYRYAYRPKFLGKLAFLRGQVKETLNWENGRFYSGDTP